MVGGVFLARILLTALCIGQAVAKACHLARENLYSPFKAGSGSSSCWSEPVFTLEFTLEMPNIGKLDSAPKRFLSAPEGVLVLL